MSKTIIQSAIMVACCLTAGSWAQQNAPAETAAPVANLNQTRLEALEQYRTKLTETFDNRPAGVTLNELDLYPLAQARIAEAVTLFKTAPDDPARIKAFQTCSLIVESALMQYQLTQARVDIGTLNNDLSGVLEQLSLVEDSVIRIASEHAAQLKDQASSLQSQLDEEKRKAAKLREEMQKKFSALQSELISVSKTARGTIISMSDILFDVGKATLKPDLKTNLAKIAGILTVYKDVNVLVEGHTDSTGTDEFNQKLSEDRSNSVMQYLIEQGVAAPRLQATGYGETKPVATNATAEGRQKNRRVDLVVQEPTPQ
jgi:outer membrane protein OmpA-like peptidoglycan-associated protein